MFLLNGYWDGDTMNGIKYIKSPVPQNTEEVKASKDMDARYIVIHNEGNLKNTSAVNLNKFMGQDDFVLWHFSVNRDTIVQGHSIFKTGFHASDGSLGKGNLFGIGIEIDEGIESVFTAFALIYQLKKQFPQLEIQPHQFFSGKFCPSWILNNLKWSGFMTKYEAYIEDMERPEPTPEVQSWKLLALNELHEAGIITDLVYWTEHIDEPLPAWASFIVMNKIRKEGKY